MNISRTPFRNNSSRYLSYNQKYKSNSEENNNFNGHTNTESNLNAESNTNRAESNTGNYIYSPEANVQTRFSTFDQPMNEKKIQRKIYEKINNTRITDQNAKKKLNNFFL